MQINIPVPKSVLAKKAITRTLLATTSHLNRRGKHRPANHIREELRYLGWLPDPFRATDKKDPQHWPLTVSKSREYGTCAYFGFRPFGVELSAHPVRHILIDITATATKTFIRIIHGPVPPIQDLATFYGIPYTWRPTDDHPDEDRHTPDMAVFTNAAGQSLEVHNVHDARDSGDWVNSQWGRPYGRQTGYHWQDLSKTGALTHLREITDWFDMLQLLLDFGADIPAQCKEDLINGFEARNRDQAYWGGPMKRELKAPDPDQKWVRTLNDWAEALKCR